jgi:hypothetical protein
MSVPDIQNALELLRQRDVDAAISSLKEKVEEIPAHLTAHVLLARAYEAKRDWTMALRSWENAHFLMPNSPIVTAGKERVLDRINEEDDAAPAPSDPSPQPPASRGDASPSTEPPEPQAPASQKPESPASPDASAAKQEAESPTHSEQQTQPESKESPETTPQAKPEQQDAHSEATSGARGESNPIAQQAQALLHNTQKSSTDEEDVASDEPTASEESTASDEPTASDSTSRDTSPPEHLQQIVGQFADAKDADSSAEIETSRRPDTTSYRPDTAIIDAAASLLSRGPTPASKDSTSEKDPSDTMESGAETSEPTSQAESGAQEREQPHDEKEESSSGNLTPEGAANAAPDASLPDASRADQFIPDFAARSTSSETDEAARSEPAQREPAHEPSEPGNAPAAETNTQESEPDAEDSERSQQASYDTYDMPESRLLDELGPPPDARPLGDEEPEPDDAQEPATAQESETKREDTSAKRALSVKPPSPDTSFSQPPLTDRLFESTSPSGQESSGGASVTDHRYGTDIPDPEDLLPSDIPHRESNAPRARESEDDASSASLPEESGGTAASGDEADGLSELEKLRRSAEQEARQGGARPELRQQLEEQQPATEKSSGNPDDTIGDLDKLIQDLESARIQPRPDLDDLPAPNLEDNVEDLVSETLARIYAAQSQYREAARIYVKLASQEPANARDHLENAADMRKKAEKKEAEARAAETSSDE